MLLLRIARFQGRGKWFEVGERATVWSHKTNIPQIQLFSWNLGHSILENKDKINFKQFKKKAFSGGHHKSWVGGAPSPIRQVGGANRLYVCTYVCMY